VADSTGVAKKLSTLIIIIIIIHYLLTNWVLYIHTYMYVGTYDVKMQDLVYTVFFKYELGWVGVYK
jgi:hypothetical protein